MQEVFEKILEKMEELKKCGTKHYEDGKYIYTSPDYDHGTLNKAIEIIKQEAEKFGTDTNVGSNGWIPCSVSMPVFGKRYLVTGVWKDKEYENYRVYDAVYGSDGIWHENYYDPVGYEVISWQPLPEPYQPKGDYDENTN